MSAHLKIVAKKSSPFSTLFGKNRAKKSAKKSRSKERTTKKEHIQRADRPRAHFSAILSSILSALFSFFWKSESEFSENERKLKKRANGRSVKILRHLTPQVERGASYLYKKKLSTSMTKSTLAETLQHPSYLKKTQYFFFRVSSMEKNSVSWREESWKCFYNGHKFLFSNLCKGLIPLSVILYAFI